MDGPAGADLRSAVCSRSLRNGDRRTRRGWSVALNSSTEAHTVRWTFAPGISAASVAGRWRGCEPRLCLHTWLFRFPRLSRGRRLSAPDHEPHRECLQVPGKRHSGCLWTLKLERLRGKPAQDL